MEIFPRFYNYMDKLVFSLHTSICLFYAYKKQENTGQVFACPVLFRNIYKLFKPYTVRQRWHQCL